MLKLVRLARRRLLHNELLAQGANALSAVLIAFVLLLVAGTQLLSWQWLVPIPIAAVAVGLYLTSRRLPSPYAAARIVDHRLALADTLSTAFYFSENEGTPASADVRRSQNERAERLAESVDLRQAVPYRWPRTIYAMLALLLVAACLFGLRYGLSRTLDLKPPLAQMLEQQFGFEVKKEQAKNNRRNLYNPMQPQAAGEDATADPNADSNADQDGMADDPQDASQDLAEQPNTATKQDAEKQADGMMAGDDMDAQAEPQSDPMGEKDGQGQQGGSSDQAKKSGSQQGANSNNNSNSENSLLSKVKDAMQNLLSKMKQPQSNPNSQQQPGEQNSGQQNGKGQANGKQQASKDGQKGEKAQQGEAQDGQNGEMAENGPEQQGKGNGKTDSQNKQAGSGAGSQDGDKNIKQAAQLAAMGKISEILGKRSANITGEATIEVETTSQQLKTAYSAKDARHSQSGGEINRDEVPVALQPFVEQYFEQVRKQAPPMPATGTKK